MSAPQANLAISSIATTALTVSTNTATLHSGDGALFPSTAPYLLHIGSPQEIGEIVLVTARATDTLTIQRGQNGTSAKAWPTSTPVQLLTGDMWGIGTALGNITTLTTADGLPVLTGNAAQALVASGTIATAALAISRVTPGASCTAVVLQAGTVAGQVVIVENDHATNSVTFDIAANSHVADGASGVIAALTAVMYVWNAVTSLWYRVI